MLTAQEVNFSQLGREIGITPLTERDYVLPWDSI
jgi:hypothetical protein